MTMAIHTIEHVQERDGDYFAGSTRVMLGSAIAAWQQGSERPESVTQAFPSISLADAYGAIAFYLDHRHELDQFFAEQLREFERQRTESQTANPNFTPTCGDVRRWNTKQGCKQPATAGFVAAARAQALQARF